MSRFTVTRPYSMPADEVRDVAERLAQKMKDSYGVSYSWRGDVASFRGSGVDGTLEIADDEIVVNVKLGLLARAFEGKLKRAMNQYLDEYIS